MTLVQDLPESTTPTLDALAYIVDDPAGSPADRKITIVNLLTGAGGRYRLEADRIYYVRVDGSDSNDGLTDSAGGAFLTIQKAVTTVASKLNLNGYNVTIQVRDGTYDGEIILDSPWDGDGTVTMIGNISTPTNVVITCPTGSSPTYGRGIWVKNGGRLAVSSMSFNRTQAGTGYAIEASSYGYVDVSLCTFDSDDTTIGGSNLYSHDFGHIEVTGDLTIAAGTHRDHLFADYFGFIGGLQYTTTFTGVPTLNIFMNARHNSTIETGTFIGTFTGTRFSVTEKSLGITSIATLSAIPGSITGSTDEDSTYNEPNEVNKVVTSAFNTTSTSLANVTGLSTTVLAGGHYEFTARLYTTSDVAGGVKAAAASTGAVTAIIYEGFTFSGTSISAHTRSTSSGTAVGAVTAVTAAYMEVKGYINPSASGTFTIQFACNVATGTSSVLQGSTLKVVRID